MSEDLPDSAQGGLAVPALVLTDGLSYEDYFRQINKMAEQMRARWKREEKVGALKLAIQLSKLLADTSQLKLYQKKYSRVVEILDEFGKYIYDRVHMIAERGDEEPAAGPEGGDDTLDDANFQFDSRELAKDIYRNWQFKILSIRELVPRFYCELAILRASDILFASTSKATTRNLEEQFYSQALRRLANYCMGLGDPVVSLHARAFLCKVAERLLISRSSGSSHGGGKGGRTSEEAILFGVLASNLRSATTLVCRLEMSLVPYSEANLYFELLSGAFQAILNIMAARYNQASGEDDEQFVARAQMSGQFEDLLAMVAKEDPCGFRRNVILNALFASLPSDIIARHANLLMAELRASHDRWRRQTDGSAKSSLVPTIYTTLSSSLTALDGNETFEERERGPREGQSPSGSSVILLAEAMIADVLEHQRGLISSNYLKCFKALLTFASHHAPTALDRPLATLVNRIRFNRQYMRHCAQLMDIIKTLFTQQPASLGDVKSLVSLRSFNQLFDFLRKDEHRLDVAKYILEMLRSNVKLSRHKGRAQNGLQRITDRVLISFLLKLFDALNSSLSPLVAQEDLRHLSEIVVFFIELVQFDDHLELVEFYSRCRASLGNLNLALEFLIERALELPQMHRKTEKRRGARLNVLNCCLAFAFTTLPAIQDQRTRVGLYIRGCRLALAHRSLSLADYFMRQIMVNLLSMVESHELQQQQQQQQIDDANRLELDDTLAEVLDMTVAQQDNIDLKHKLALSQLIRVSFSECPNLLQSLNNLNCVDDDHDDARGEGTVNNMEI